MGLMGYLESTPLGHSNDANIFDTHKYYEENLETIQYGNLSYKFTYTCHNWWFGNKTIGMSHDHVQPPVEEVHIKRLDNQNPMLSVTACHFLAGTLY